MEALTEIIEPKLLTPVESLRIATAIGKKEMLGGELTVIEQVQFVVRAVEAIGGGEYLESSYLPLLVSLEEAQASHFVSQNYQAEVHKPLLDTLDGAPDRNTAYCGYRENYFRELARISGEGEPGRKAYFSNMADHWSTYGRIVASVS
ncbi:MAG: hypothetical protein PHS44_05755 [Candidatus Dojkabacteria bacterium]|nr:hypothetical protein [Candidatus Dojkabacteria bacterium]